MLLSFRVTRRRNPLTFVAHTSRFQQAIDTSLMAEPLRWLVTGAVRFICSNLVQELLGLAQKVVGLDNFSTGQMSARRVGCLATTPRTVRFCE
jgi:hypothetical protein